MIRISKDGTVQLKGKPAQILRIAIAGIREEVECDLPDGSCNTDDWPDALAEFIAEDFRKGEVVDEARDQDINIRWHNMEFHHHVDGVQPD